MLLDIKNVQSEPKCLSEKELHIFFPQIQHNVICPASVLLFLSNIHKESNGVEFNPISRRQCNGKTAERGGVQVTMCIVIDYAYPSLGSPV